jgi:hypothetical protein
MTTSLLFAISKSAERYLEYKAGELEFYNFITLGLFTLVGIYLVLKFFGWIWNKICDIVINL